MRPAQLLLLAVSCASLQAQTVTIDTSPAGRRQTMDGFGSCLAGTEAQQAWWQALYYDDLQASILRVDLTPKFKSPYNGQNGTYNSPWYHNNPSLPGPDGNNVRGYTNAASYTNLFNGWRAPIAVMGPNIDANTHDFDFNNAGPRTGGLAAKAGARRLPLIARVTGVGDRFLDVCRWRASQSSATAARPPDRRRVGGVAAAL